MASSFALSSALPESNPVLGMRTHRCPNAILTRFQRPACSISPRSAKTAIKARRLRSGSRSHPITCAYSNAAHDLEGQTHPPRQSGDVWIGKTKGLAFIGKAEITSDPAVAHQIVQDYPKRYLMARLGMHTPTQEMFDKGQIIPITIRPIRDLPEGFCFPARQARSEHRRRTTEVLVAKLLLRSSFDCGRKVRDAEESCDGCSVTLFRDRTRGPGGRDR